MNVREVQPVEILQGLFLVVYMLLLEVCLVAAGFMFVCFHV